MVPKIRTAEEVRRGELLIARLDTLIMQSAGYRDFDLDLLEAMVTEYKTRLAVIDRDADSYRDEIGQDDTLKEIQTKTTGVSDIIKNFEKQVDKLKSTTDQKWCAVHSRYNCVFGHMAVAAPDPPKMKMHAPPLSRSQSPLEIKPGERVDMSERFPEFGCTDCPDAADCFKLWVCFNGAREQLPPDLSSEEVKRLVETTFVVQSAEGESESDDDVLFYCEHCSRLCAHMTVDCPNRKRDHTPMFDHCTICWDRIPYGESYCDQCFATTENVKAEIAAAEKRNADGEVVPVTLDEVWSD